MNTGRRSPSGAGPFGSWPVPAQCADSPRLLGRNRFRISTDPAEARGSLQSQATLTGGSPRPDPRVGRLRPVSGESDGLRSWSQRSARCSQPPRRCFSRGAGPPRPGASARAAFQRASATAPGAAFPALPAHSGKLESMSHKNHYVNSHLWSTQPRPAQGRRPGSQAPYRPCRTMQSRSPAHARPLALRSRTALHSANESPGNRAFRSPSAAHRRPETRPQRFQACRLRRPHVTR